MAYFQDMSPYNYIAECVLPNTFNVGWLSRDHPYEKGVVPEQFPDRLLEFCKFSICQTRGWHICEFCITKENTTALEMKVNDKITIYLGSAEIRVVGGNKIFASPDLIYHYVTVHQYLPPKEFVDAVLFGPLPSSKNYKELIGIK